MSQGDDLSEVKNVRIDAINVPSFLNFRTNIYGSEQFKELVSSIRKIGLLHPLILRKSLTNGGAVVEKKFDLICGSRRLAACRELGKKTVASMVLDASDQQSFEIALSENLQRQSLNPIEEAEAFKTYVCNYGHGGVTRLAKKIGKSEEYVSHRLLLLGLPKSLIDKISRRLLNAATATELVWIGNERQQLELSEQILKNKLSEKEVRDVARKLKNNQSSVDDAVSGVVRLRKGFLRTSSPASDDESSGTPWLDYESCGSDNVGQHLKIFERAELVMRSAIAGLDLIAKDTDHSDISDLIMKERQIVHGVLDDLVRSKVIAKKSGMHILFAPRVSQN